MASGQAQMSNRGLGKRPKSKLTPNGTIHDDLLYVIRHDQGAIQQVGDLLTVMRNAALYEEMDGNKGPKEVAEYKLVSIKKYDVEIKPVEAN